MEAVADSIFLGSKITVDGDCTHEIKRHLLLGRKAMTKYRQHIKKQRHHFASKGPYHQSYGFPSSQVWMWELVRKACWMPKDWYFSIAVLEKTLESPLDCKEIKPVNSKEYQPWIFIGKTVAEALIVWPPDAKEPTYWKRLWCWERLKAKGEGGGGRRDC